MAYVKTAIGTIFILIVLLVGYKFFAVSSDHELQGAYKFFLKGDYEHSQNELAKLKGSTPADQADLYDAYVARALKQWDQAHHLLTEAAVAAQQVKSPLLLEIRLNQALNAYLEHDAAALKQAVDAAAEIAPNQSWVTFFQALESFEGGDYSKALELWSVRTDRVPLSSWMKVAFDQVFSRRWMVIALSRCQIEVGKYLMARQTIEEEIEGASESELVELNFLLGLSYAKEAQEKTPTAAAPYWKLAFSYFSKVPFKDVRYDAERQKLAAAIEKQVIQLIDSKIYQDLPFYAVTLQTWGADSAVNRLTTNAIAQLNRAVADGQWNRVDELAAVVNRMIPEGDVRQSLQKRFQVLATTALINGNLAQLFEYWNIAHLLSSHPDQLSTEFSAKVSAKVAALIPIDDPNLSRTIPLIRFWANLMNQPEAQFAVAKALISFAETSWLAPGGDVKAEHLLEIAHSLTPKNDKPAFDDALNQMVVRIYNEVNKRDDIEKLPAILTAAERYHITEIDISSPAQVQRHAALAQELLRQGHYDQAYQRVLWILKLEPSNQVANLIAGIILYDRADYAQAKEHLSAVKQPSVSVREALAISQILTGDENVGLESLKQLSAIKPLRDEALLRLGLGLLERGEPVEGMSWLVQIQQPSQEAIVGQAYAAFLLKQYEKVQRLVKQLQAPYRLLDGVQGLAIQSDVMQGRTDAAEKALIELLRQPEQASGQDMSSSFRKFEQLKMAEFGRQYLAGLFFRDVKKNNDIAIKYFRLVKQPTPVMSVIRAQTFLDLGLYDEALVDLTASVNQTLDPGAAVQAMPWLAIVLDHKQLRLEALTWFQRYFDLYPKTAEFRANYAHLLVELRRYDLALTQFALAGGWERLSPEDVVTYARCLFHLGHNDQVIAIGDKLLSYEPPVPLTSQLAMMRVLAYANHLQSSWPILKSVPAASKLSDSEAIQLLEFLLELGSYSQAISVASDKQADLRKSVDGLLVLAKLSDRLGQVEDALIFLRLAHDKEPNNLDVVEAVGQYAYQTQVLENSVDQLENRVKDEPNSPSVRLAYAHQVARLGSFSRSKEGRINTSYTSEYQHAAFEMEKLAKTFDTIPEIHSVWGQLLGLLNKPKEAIESLRNALQLDPSYAEAAIQLAAQYVQQNDVSGAIRVLFTASQYEPDDARTWLLLANLSQARGNLFEASQYYQNAIKFSPNNIGLYVVLGKVFMDIRNPEDAKVVLEHALTLEPKNVAALTLLLECLHDPLLKANTDDLKKLAAEQAQAYKQLRAINPQVADKLIGAIDQRDGHDTEDFPLLDDDHQTKAKVHKEPYHYDHPDLMPKDGKHDVLPPDDLDLKARQSIPEDEEDFSEHPANQKH